VAMANLAQLVNNLDSLFLAVEDQFIVTPNYRVFAMYAAHQGGQALRTVFGAPTRNVREGQERWSLDRLAGSASKRGKILVLTAVNTDAQAARDRDRIARGFGAIRESQHTGRPGYSRAQQFFSS